MKNNRNACFPELNQLYFQVECETARQMLQFLILGTSSESYSGLDLWQKYGEMSDRNQSSINRLEKLREPVENIRRDLNSDLSSDLYDKFVEVNRMLQSLQCELVLSLIDAARPVFDEWNALIRSEYGKVQVIQDSKLPEKHAETFEFYSLLQKVLAVLKNLQVSVQEQKKEFVEEDFTKVSEELSSKINSTEKVLIRLNKVYQLQKEFEVKEVCFLK